MAKHNKKQRIARRSKNRVAGSALRPRVAIHRTNNHIYAQIVNDENGKTLVSVSDATVSSTKKAKKTKIEVAGLVGVELASEAKTKKIKSVVFDRGRFKYHGRVKALAEAAREGGLKF